MGWISVIVGLYILLAACTFMAWASKGYAKHLKPKLFPWEEKYVMSRVEREADLILSFSLWFLVVDFLTCLLGGDRSRSLWVLGIAYFFCAFFYGTLAKPRESERPIVIRVGVVKQTLIAIKLMWFVTYVLILVGLSLVVSLDSIRNNFNRDDDLCFHYDNATLATHRSESLQEQVSLSNRICGVRLISRCFLSLLPLGDALFMTVVVYLAHLTLTAGVLVGWELLEFGWGMIVGWEGAVSYSKAKGEEGDEERRRSQGLAMHDAMEMVSLGGGGRGVEQVVVQ